MLDDASGSRYKDNYCSSSSDEDDTNFQDTAESQQIPMPRNTKGLSKNTGPKGVMEDWRCYKEMERVNREKQHQQLIASVKQHSITARTDKEDEEAKADEVLLRELDEEDGFLKEYMRKRMQQLMTASNNAHTAQGLKFGKLKLLQSSDEFLSVVDETPAASVFIHIFRKNAPGCDAMNGCLSCLAQQYPNLLFCAIEASTVGTSKRFMVKGVPAIQVYKKGELIGNFVRLTEELGEDFFTDELEAFLSEHGLLNEHYRKQGDSKEDEASGSDFDLD